MSAALGRFCKACQAIPQAGYCNLKGCPMPVPLNWMDREFTASGKVILILSEGGGSAMATAGNEANAVRIAERLNEANRLQERLQAIIDWADLALSNPTEFDSHGARLLSGPVFDAARDALGMSA